MRLTTLSALSLSAALGFVTADARALPWVDDFVPGLSDPLGAERQIGPYAKDPKLKPASCPTIPSGKHTYTLEEVVVLALCNNPETRTAYLSLLASSYSNVQAYSAYFPTATGSASWSRSTFFTPHSTSISRSSGVSASVTLYDFGQRELSIEIAENTLAAAGNSYYSTLQGVIATSLNSYYTLLTSQNSVLIAEESERYAQASYEAAALKYDIGQVALADRLQAKSSYSSALLSTQSARNSLAVQKASLARLMGLPPDENIEVAELDDTNLTLEPFDGQLEHLMAEAKQKRVDLISERLQLENAKISLKKTRREDLATISAGVNADLDRPEIIHGGTSRSQSIGVSVSIPIFTGFTNTYNKRAAENSLESQKISLQKTELDVEQDVWNAWHNYQTAQKSWETSLDLIKSATEFKDVALGRYKEGIGTILDVLSAQSQYSSALQSQLQTRYNLLTTRIDLVRAVGVLNLETMRPENKVPLPPAPETTPLPPPATEAAPASAVETPVETPAPAAPAEIPTGELQPLITTPEATTPQE